MPKFNIETYLNSLPENTTEININCRGVTYLPELTRFINLQHLSCDDNYLISLPALPNSLRYLSCHRNKLRSLPVLPENLRYLYCSYNPIKSLPELPPYLQDLYCMKNQLTSLPELPPNLLYLYLTGNELTSLPALPETLRSLYCNHNRLTSMPFLPKSIKNLDFDFNPVWKTIKKLNSFRHLYYSLKFKDQFRNWLWEKVRRPKIEQKYHPNYLIDNLSEDNDLDEFLHYWINCRKL